MLARLLENAAMKTAPLLSPVIFTLCCFGLWQNARAVNPPPDGGYPNFTTAERTNALQNLTSGAGNTGLGWHSFFTDSTGNYNTGVGAGTLLFNNADSNTAIGTAALLFNTGPNNTAVGATALLNNTEGGANTAAGADSLLNNATDNGNTAMALPRLKSIQAAMAIPPLA
jgi:hypothetical protein